MTSISSAGFTPQAFTSPRELLQNELQSEVSSGAISADDQDALSAALDDIGSALRGQRTADRAAGAGRPSPSEMKSKIDDLIASEVQNGNLTSDQAEELKNIFAKALPQHGGPGGAGGPGGPGGAEGPGGPDGSCGSCAGGQAGTSSGTSGGSDVSQVLADFLQTLQQSLSQDSTYNANGDAANISITSLVVNYQA
jgi:hypothetical protein